MEVLEDPKNDNTDIRARRTGPVLGLTAIFIGMIVLGHLLFFLFGSPVTSREESLPDADTTQRKEKGGAGTAISYPAFPKGLDSVFFLKISTVNSSIDSLMAHRETLSGQEELAAWICGISGLHRELSDCLLQWAENLPDTCDVQKTAEIIAKSFFFTLRFVQKVAYKAVKNDIFRLNRFVI